MPRPPLPPRPGLIANLTPMIDVVFQLIIFFMLVARFSEEQAIDLILARVNEQAMERIETESRAVVNVVPRARAAGMGGAYRLGLNAFPDSPQGIRGLAAALSEIRQRQPNVEVFVRAERTEAYSRVHPAVQAVALAGIRRVHLVTLPAGTGGEP